MKDSNYVLICVLTIVWIGCSRTLIRRLLSVVIDEGEGTSGTSALFGLKVHPVVNAKAQRTISYMKYDQYDDFHAFIPSCIAKFSERFRLTIERIT